MKFSISCPHYPQCQEGHKGEVEIKDFPKICGVLDCDKVAQGKIREGFTFYEVCLVHANGKEFK